MLDNYGKGTLDIIPVGLETSLEDRTNNIMKILGGFYCDVTKTLIQINPDDNSEQNKQYLKKISALNKLFDIEIYLTKYESILQDQMLADENNDTKILKIIGKNIIKVGNKIARIHMKDDEIQNKVISVSFQIFNLLRILNNKITRNNFDAKINEAKINYEEIINDSEQLNAEQSKESLENLKRSIQNLKVSDEKRKLRKQDLITKIEHDILTISKSIQQEISKQVIIQEETERKFSSLSHFSSLCDDMLNNLNLNDCNDLELKKFDSLLKEIEIKIQNTRLQISTSRKISSSTFTSSQSIPNQVVSLNIIDSVATETFSCSIFNLFKFKSTKVLKLLSKVQDIKNEVDHIGNNMDEFTEDETIKYKLEIFFKEVMQYTNKGDDVLVKNSTELADKIQTLLYRIYLKEYENSIYQLTGAVEKFNGSQQDTEYKNLKYELTKLKESLKTFQIPNQHSAYRQEQKQLIRAIHFNLNRLFEKTTIREDNSITILEQKLKELNERVYQFSGMYKGVLFNEIERDLHKLLVNTEERIEDKEKHDEFTGNIEAMFEILKQQATPPPLIEDLEMITKKKVLSSAAQNENVTKIKQVLTEIATEINTMNRFRNGNVEDFIKLKVRLNLVEIELNKFSTTELNKNLKKAKDSFEIEISWLKMLVDERILYGCQNRLQGNQLVDRVSNGEKFF